SAARASAVSGRAGGWGGGGTRPWHDTEVAILGINRVETTVVSYLHPGDVVPDGGDLPSGKMSRRDEHRKIGFPARARESGGDVMLFPFRRLDSQNQHVLGEPALFLRQVGGNAEGKTFFAQQNVAPVAGANGDD